MRFLTAVLNHTNGKEGQEKQGQTYKRLKTLRDDSIIKTTPLEIP